MLSAQDVTVTLSTQYGESYRLKAEGEHIQYAVFSAGNETQVAVTFRHAAFAPVFTTMTIDVNGAGLSASRHMTSPACTPTCSSRAAAA